MYYLLLIYVKFNVSKLLKNVNTAKSLFDKKNNQVVCNCAFFFAGLKRIKIDQSSISFNQILISYSFQTKSSLFNKT